MKSNRTISLLLLLLLSFCAKASAQSSEQDDANNKLISSESYRKHLKLFNEPHIFPTPNQNTEAYRLTILPTIDNPLSIRVENIGSNYVLTAKRLSGQGGYNAGTIKQERQRRITEREWNLLLNLINEANVWKLPTDDENYEPDEKGQVTICLDGSDWFLEGVKSGDHHAVNRYCPESKSFEAIGLYLVKLSKLGVKRAALY